jgi:nucleoid DNA-binding protein
MEDRKLPFPAFNYYLDEGRNPQSGEKMKIPASKVPAFKAGKSLKDSI